jgi:tetratricopeptide (TPR) repeat protein
MMFLGTSISLAAYGAPVADETPEELLQSARNAENAGFYREALGFYEQVLVIQQENQGPEAPETLEAANTVARMNLVLANYPKALELYQTILDIREKLGNKLNVAESMLDVATSHWHMRNWEKAKNFALQSMNIREKKSGIHLDTADSMYRLGSIYAYLGDIPHATRLYKQALSIQKEISSSASEDEKTARTLDKIADIHMDLGEYAEAKENYEHALVIRLELFGRDHPDTASSFNKLGNVYRYLVYAKAGEYYERALAVRLKLSGGDHPETARVLSNLGKFYNGLKNYEKAKEYYERALAIQSKVFDKKHPDVAMLYYNLNTICVSLGDREKAKEYERYAPRDCVTIKASGEVLLDTAEPPTTNLKFVSLYLKRSHGMKGLFGGK